MGLTVHYGFQSNTRSINKVRHAITELRQRALDLPFEQVNDLIELSGQECNFEHYTTDDPRRWLVVQAGRHIQLPGRDDMSYRVTPDQLIAFEVIPGDGCEPANFGLCRYPAFMDVRDPSSHRNQRIRTRLSGWSWSSFCKTQYASNPACGGTANFLRCHLSLIKMLDHAKSLDILDEVDDEGGFWQRRDMESLARGVGEWNVSIAAFVGRLKDQFGDDFQAAITSFGNFEHLEAKGRLEPSEAPPN